MREMHKEGMRNLSSNTEQVLRIIKEQTDLSPAVTDKMSELDMDSLDHTYIVMRCEEVMDIELADEKLEMLRSGTVQDFINLVNATRGQS